MKQTITKYLCMLQKYSIEQRRNSIALISFINFVITEEEVNMGNGKKMWLLLIGLISIINVVCGISWNRSIVNKTSHPWIVDAQDSIHGNFYATCSDHPNRTYENAALIIPPNATCKTHMTTHSNEHLTYVGVWRAIDKPSSEAFFELTDYNTNSIMDFKFFDDGADSNGGIILNKPDGGDLILNDYSKPATGGVSP
jgi:hypothetical protein